MEGEKQLRSRSLLTREVEPPQMITRGSMFLRALIQCDWLVRATAG